MRDSYRQTKIDRCDCRETVMRSLHPTKNTIVNRFANKAVLRHFNHPTTENSRSAFANFAVMSVPPLLDPVFHSLTSFTSRTDRDRSSCFSCGDFTVTRKQFLTAGCCPYRKDPLVSHARAHTRERFREREGERENGTKR